MESYVVVTVRFVSSVTDVRFPTASYPRLVRDVSVFRSASSLLEAPT